MPSAETPVPFHHLRSNGCGSQPASSVLREIVRNIQESTDEKPLEFDSIDADCAADINERLQKDWEHRVCRSYAIVVAVVGIRVRVDRDRKGRCILFAAFAMFVFIAAFVCSVYTRTRRVNAIVILESSAMENRPS
jgi:hypothetical protein